jgi:superoxide dismutase, Fe-Mn family
VPDERILNTKLFFLTTPRITVTRHQHVSDTCLLPAVESRHLTTACACTQAFFSLPPLSYPYSGLESWIDTETMMLHHSRHHQAAVTGLVNVLTATPSLQKSTLSKLLQNVGKYDVPANVTTAVRNNAGSHFNHAMFWRTMRPTWYDQDTSKPKNVRSPTLKSAIKASFGTHENFTAVFSDAAAKLFGSGWVWLCYKPATAKLAVVSTPNQDNPLMRHFVAPAAQCTPILGLDVWEHSYYLLHRNVRKDYVSNWWLVVNWHQVSKNLLIAKAGKLDSLWR